VELLSAIVLVIAWQQFGRSVSFLHYSVLLLMLLPITFIDLNTRLILNVFTVPGIVVALLFASFSTQISIAQALLGLVLGGGFLVLIGTFGRMVFRKESMGGGDVKLGAMIGAFLGPQVFIVLILAFFLAVPVIVIGLDTNRVSLGSALPFGPFIALSAAIMVLFGEGLYYHYFQLIGIL
jgi:leader peptidase (prepilin peptidase)/N-methyltransferase